MTEPTKTVPSTLFSRPTRLIAVIAGLLGIALAIGVPLLPVISDDVTLQWPQSDEVTSVSAPLAGYVPIDVDVVIPCAAVRELAGRAAVVLSTIPGGSPNARKDGLIAVTDPPRPGQPAQLRIVLRNIAVLTAPLSQLTGAGCQVQITSTATQTTTTITGAPSVDAPVLRGDYRPQMVGVFTDLTGPGPAGLAVTAHLDDRFASTPSVVKSIAAILAVIATCVALAALHWADRSDGRGSLRVLPPRWRTFTILDATVLATLFLWHVIGANTADDGYQLGMARASERAGYMVNYFRYWGVPETPFGTPYYDVFVLFANISTASIWVRVPALILGVASWWVISREVLPRLGLATRSSQLPAWTAGLVFLAFWLPYNNGLRPEPVVALGVLLTWCAVERAVANRRLFPVAMAMLVAAFTLTAGPSGLICVAALIAGSRPVVAIVRHRAARVGYPAVVLPLIASGVVVLAAVFADQPLATVPAMLKAHLAAGPSLGWFEEYMRYQYLLQDTVDGSPARRFGVFVMIGAVVAVTAVLLRKGGRIPGVAAGPARRLLGVTAGSMVLMMFTPTKWTHHFGVFAGLAASVSALLVIAVGANVLRSRRNRALVAAATSFLMALVLTSRNGYWYVSTWGVPWFDKAPSVHGFAASTVFRGATVLALGAALWFHVHDPSGGTPPHEPGRRRWWSRTSPVTVAAALMVLLEVGSLAKATITQYPAYSVGRSNIDALTGHPCGLANDVLVETDPNASMLTPLRGSAAEALSAGSAVGFTPNGVAADLASDEDANPAGTANSVTTNTAGTTSAPTSSAGTSGGQGATGTNGSSVALPFGLDPKTTPVLGSYGATGPATLTTGWYRLPTTPPDGHRGDLIAIAAAGRVASTDHDGISHYGQDVHLEYGTSTASGDAAAHGSITPIDIGPTPSWRNLRIPLSDIPSDADVIRIVATDTDLDPDQWVAITPPRVPRTEVLNTLVGPTAPVMIDWAVGLNFPCQHLITLRDGVLQSPGYRILPDRHGAQTTNLWQDHTGGGPLGWIDLLLTANTLPSYLKDDLSRDWGELERYTPRQPNTQPARLSTATSTRSGLWTPAPIKTN
ncbi:arabinosyltransferase [Mycobacterium hodleri]|nr:arabinosyltransferase [Mycolicibacterium hodleri]